MQRRLRGRIVPPAPAERGYAGQGRSVDWGASVGEIVVEIELENAGDFDRFEAGELCDADVRRAVVSAVADTGAIMLALPEDVVDQLGIEWLGSIATTYADGRRGQLPIAGSLIVRIDDRWMSTECIVLPRGAEALVGQLVMEALDLIADCVNQTLSPRPESPDRPMMRV